MKKYLLSFILLSFSFFSFAQNQLVLNFNHQVGGEALLSEQEYIHNDLGYSFSITRLQYYISQVEIIHDGGQITSISDTWLLVNALENENYDLGSHDIQEVEEIRYWIGVEPEVNHLDPASYPEEHPLALQNPSMHWGWASGYRFCALEGKTGPSLILTYELHSLGDANYKQVSIPSSNTLHNDQLFISIDADYMGLYKDLDVSGGLISHGEIGDAAKLLDNFSTEVFSQLMFTGTEEALGLQVDFSLAPNPASINNAKLYLDKVSSENMEIHISDISGRMIKKQQLNSNESLVDIDISEPGMYFISILNGKEILKTKKLLIQ